MSADAQAIVNALNNLVGTVNALAAIIGFCTAALIFVITFVGVRRQ
jgi:hypothetical protein